MHSYYTFESVHDGDHDGVVIGLSCELWGFLKYITLHYVTQFFPYQEYNVTVNFLCYVMYN